MSKIAQQYSYDFHLYLTSFIQCLISSTNIILFRREFDDMMMIKMKELEEQKEMAARRKLDAENSRIRFTKIFLMIVSFILRAQFFSIFTFPH